MKMLTVAVLVILIAAPLGTILIVLGLGFGKSLTKLNKIADIGHFREEKQQLLWILKP